MPQKANNASSKKGERVKNGKVYGIRYRIVISLKGFKSIIYLEDGVKILTDSNRDILLNRTEKFIKNNI